MPRMLGHVQRKLLSALRHHGGDASLDSLAALAAGLIPDLGTRPPYDRTAGRAIYVSVARAVAALRRRGLVQTKKAGTTKGRIEWHRNEAGSVRPVWRFTNPSTRLFVRFVAVTSKEEKA